MSKTARILFIASIVLNVAMAIIGVCKQNWNVVVTNGSTAIFIGIIYWYAERVCELSEENQQLKIEKLKRDAQDKAINNINVRDFVKQLNIDIDKLCSADSDNSCSTT